MKLIDYIVNAFVMVDDLCNIYYPPRKLRDRGPLPKLAKSNEIFGLKALTSNISWGVTVYEVSYIAGYKNIHT